MQSVQQIVIRLVVVVMMMVATASADPLLTVTDLGLNGSSNREWLVEVAPDASLFTTGPNGTGGSLAVELGFEITGNVLGATSNVGNFPFDNPGNNPFTSSVSFGIDVDTVADSLFAALGSNFFTTGDPVEVLTIETAGSGMTTVAWGGQTINAGGGYVGSRIAQAGMNFDGIMGSVTAGGGGLDCDFDGSGTCDLIDLELMLAEGPINGAGVPVSGNGQFDLNGDGNIDLMDRDAWLASAASENGLGSPYRLGDANLDGGVDVSDFNLWNGSKFQSTLEWGRGNFNGDNVVDVSDFNAWNSNKFTSSDAATVPEPTSWFSLVSALILLGFVRRR